MDSPSFTYNMRYQIHWLYVPNRYLILLRLLRTLYSYSAYDDDLGRGPHRPDRLTSHIARTATGPCRFHALGLPAPWSPVFHRDLIGFCLDLIFFSLLFLFHFRRVCCVFEHTDKRKSRLLKKKKKARVDHRQKNFECRPRVRGYDVSSWILPGFPGSWNDEESSKPPHDWYHAALTGIWGQLG